jgi:hypothetical protein
VQRIVEELHRVLHEGDGVPTLAAWLAASKLVGT